MKRKEFPQLSNQKWFPRILKRNLDEFLTWFVKLTKAARPFMPVINEGLKHSDHKIIAINSPIGAGFETVQPYIEKDIIVKNVNLSALQTDEKGLYLSVNSFHQLRPEEAAALLQKIAGSKNAVAVLEGNNDSLWQGFGMLVIVPLAVILTAPFVHPFRISRLIFTYVIPVLPLITMLDGFLALFKLYAPRDLEELVSKINVPDYYWRSGKLPNGRGGKIIYLIGYPKGIAVNAKMAETEVMMG